MGKKKNKFDLTTLVHESYIKDGETISFVSDPTKTAKVAKQPNGEYKLLDGKDVTTVHAFAQKCLGTEPPDHASKWFRSTGGKTLYELWDYYLNEDGAMAA